MLKMQNLFIILNERSIPRKDLCQAVNVSNGNLSDWKSGRCLPSADVLMRMADYLDTSVDYLLGRSERSEPAAPELAPEYQEIVELYQDLTPEQQSLIKATMQSWLAVNDTAAIEKKKDV